MTVSVKIWVGWVGAAAVLGGVGVWAAMGAGQRAAAPVVAEPVRGAPAFAAPVAPVAATVAGPEAPRFDVVRVSPEGRAVIAGRAEPGAEVVVRDGDAEVARARAGSDGAFVALPETPFAPGGRELTLTSRNGAGWRRGATGRCCWWCRRRRMRAGRRRRRCRRCWCRGRRRRGCWGRRGAIRWVGCRWISSIMGIRGRSGLRAGRRRAGRCGCMWITGRPGMFRRMGGGGGR